MSDQQELSEYVDLWWQSINDFTALLELVPVEQWSTPTDLPGWDVHAVASHVAHLEGVLAGSPEETVTVGDPPHARGLMGLYTEQGVVARKDRTPDELINEIRAAATARHTALLTEPPTDGAQKPDLIFGGVPWDWRQLLRNRPLDVWMHEQDVRRAVGQPGGMDSAAAGHTAEYLTESLGFVLAKRIGAAAGTSVALEVAGCPTVAYVVNDAGRGEQLADVPSETTARLAMDRETFILLAGGRRAPGDIQVTGDQELGRQVVDAFHVTP